MYKVCDNGVEYYTIERIRDIQAQMLRLLTIVDDVCKKEKLQYFLDGGTAIGAFRHGGFIPWDDDLDICMLKPDYLKLIEALKEMDRTRFFLFDYEFDLHPCSFFGEKIKMFSCADDKRRHIYPIKIDIIPLNFVENSEESLYENRLLRELSNLLFLGNCSDEYKSAVLKLYDERFSNDRKQFMRFYNLQYGTIVTGKEFTLARPSMSFSTPRTYAFDDMFPLRPIKFSGLDTYVPATDSWLRDIYGNYMEMPDVEKRKPEARKVFDTWNAKPLYKYLIDKTEKTRMQMLFFSLKATLYCK